MKDYVIVHPVLVDVFEMFVLYVLVPLNVVFLFLLEIVSMIEDAFLALAILVDEVANVLTSSLLCNHSIYLFVDCEVVGKHVDYVLQLSRVVLVEMEVVVRTRKVAVVNYFNVICLSNEIQILDSNRFHQTIHYNYFLGVLEQVNEIHDVVPPVIAGL